MHFHLSPDLPFTSSCFLLALIQVLNIPMFSRILSNNVGQSALRASRMSTKPHWPSSTYKTTTGLVGLAVDTNARNTLLQLTDECLKSVQVMSDWFDFIEFSLV